MIVSLTQYHYKHDNIIKERKSVSFCEGHNTAIFTIEIRIWFNVITILMEHCSRPSLHKTSTTWQNASCQAVKYVSPKLPCRLQNSLTLKSIFRVISQAHVFSNDSEKCLFNITLQYFLHVFWSKLYMHFSYLQNM